MAKVYSFNRDLNFDTNVDSIQTQVSALQVSFNNFSNRNLLQEELTISANGQTEFTLQDDPAGNKILLSLNGQLLSQGTDYSLDNKTINVLIEHLLETSDILVASYLA